ncbi:hypothetical protein llap_12030 [Limosa lapponica baueri]|uniref:Uncharacterized protein n=1 Tax=Limosa lapponica baueri TaxID=1758121 RepID=A0A2I0TV39_LIMLA|nr:hypothetical protein llap_12030 [Limosa lapponica baueri]
MERNNHALLSGCSLPQETSLLPIPFNVYMNSVEKITDSTVIQRVNLTAPAINLSGQKAAGQKMDSHSAGNVQLVFVSTPCCNRVKDCHSDQGTQEVQLINSYVVYRPRVEFGRKLESSHKGLLKLLTRKEEEETEVASHPDLLLSCMWNKQEHPQHHPATMDEAGEITIHVLNHRIVGVTRDLWRSASPTPLPYEDNDFV